MEGGGRGEAPEPAWFKGLTLKNTPLTHTPLSPQPQLKVPEG